MTKRKYDDSQSRVNVACERCRKRHIRCDGESVCSNCTKTKAKCVYVEGEKKIVVSLKYLRSLQDEIKSLSRRVGEGGDSIERSSAPPTGSGQDSGQGSTPTSGPGSTTLSAGPGPTTFSANGGQDTNVANNSTATSSSVGASTANLSFCGMDRSEVSAGRDWSVFQGSSSLSIFGLEIRDILPYDSKKIDFSEQDAGPVDNRFEGCKVTRDGLKFYVTFSPPHLPDHWFELPSYEHTVRCVEVYKTYLDECFYFFNTAQFLKRLRNTHFGPQNQETYTRLDFLWYTQIFLIVAVGEMYLGIPPAEPCLRYPGFERFPGIQHFDMASVLYSITTDGTQINGHTIIALEVLLLYAYYHQAIRSSTGYYVLSGMSMRSALALGMHVTYCGTSDLLNQLTWGEREHRRRMWWTIYNNDRFLSAKSGFPMSIADDAVFTELPEDAPDYYKEKGGDEMGDFAPSKYIRAYTEIMQIYSSSIVELYKPGKNKDVLGIITNVMAKLVGWRKNLDGDLCVDFKVPDSDLKVSRTATNIYSEYHQCINLAVRPLLLALLRKRILDKPNHAPVNTSTLPDNVLTLLNASLDACIQTIRALNYLNSRGMYSTYGYLDREYTFYAASTLVMFNAAFSINKSTQAYIDVALTLLSGIDAVRSPSLNLRKIQLMNFMSAFDFMEQTNSSTVASKQPSANATTNGNASLINPSPSVVSNDVQQMISASSVVKTEQQPPAMDPLPSASSPHYYEVFNPSRPVPSEVPWTVPLIDNSYIDPGERALWDEISAESFWLGNISDEFKSLLEENL
uniref:ARAD1C05192p n=1 Tax=Blastobotrys adeninivorans TaxID=409370 RepID=A0A060T4M4_BLAAD